MDHVIVRWESSRGGYWLDATAYESLLPTLAPTLPPGAREFALDSRHYDFANDRCVKDLWFRSLEVTDGQGGAHLSFAPNSSKHKEGLDLVYSEVEAVSVARERDPGVGWLGSPLLDEVRPAREGVIHELALTGGQIRITAGDVVADWR